MINKIIEWSAKNRVFIFLAAAFAVAWGIWSVKNAPLDAIPDLSDTQVIVYSTVGQPAADSRGPGHLSHSIGPFRRAESKGCAGHFLITGYSYVYVIFEDGTDVYWARSRVLEYLSKIQNQLPQGVKTELGPDATGVGWVYEYALVDYSGKNSLESLKTFQDWHLKYALQSVKGVAEVASSRRIYETIPGCSEPERAACV